MLRKIRKDIRRLEAVADRDQMDLKTPAPRRMEAVARTEARIRCKRAIAGVLSQLSSMQDQAAR